MIVRKTAIFKIVLVLGVVFTLLAFHSLSQPPVNEIDIQESVIEFEDICDCPANNRLVNKSITAKEMWCSAESIGRGDKQKVVAYSLFGDPLNPGVSARYFYLLGSHALRILKFYPGWTMRVYHNFKKSNKRIMRQLCYVYCHNPHVDLCNITQIHRDPQMDRLTNYSGWGKLNPRMWRFLAVLDPQVDYFASRDMDTIIIKREVAAVQQWIESNYTFHVMRDHPYHSDITLAGMWGAKVFRNRPVVRDVVLNMVREGIDQEYVTDQLLLKKYFWPVAKFDVMAHDSYGCSSHLILNQSVTPTFPFPAQRNARRDFVGSVITDPKSRNRLPPCPVKCRPPQHQDWTYC